MDNPLIILVAVIIVIFLIYMWSVEPYITYPIDYNIVNRPNISGVPRSCSQKPSIFALSEGTRNYWANGLTAPCCFNNYAYGIKTPALYMPGRGSGPGA